MGVFFVLSGPSCVGKGPLIQALRKFYPELMGSFRKLVLYNDRTARPGERDGVDYHFRTRQAIKRLKLDRDFIVIPVRCDLQAVDVSALMELLDSGDVFFEGNPNIVSAVRELPFPADVRFLSVFLSPLSREEIVYLQREAQSISLQEFATDIMRRKLLRRTTKQKGLLSSEDLANIEIRASSALEEMRQACNFDYVIVNHDGEDSENWDAFYYPIGDARKTMLSVAELLQGRVPPVVDNWGDGLLKDA